MSKWKQLEKNKVVHKRIQKKVRYNYTFETVVIYKLTNIKFDLMKVFTVDIIIIALQALTNKQ